MPHIDLNCDMGESFGVYTLGNDAEMLRYVTSANIACGFHAGDPATMRRTVRLCLERGVAIGAHPGLPDMAGFGRRRMDITPEEARDLIVYQIGALQAFVRAEGGAMAHVKPHGALYNMAAADARLAAAIADAVRSVDPRLILYGLAGSELIRAGRAAGLRTASEVFADRTYQADGTLTPRSRAEALLREPEEAAAQALSIVRQGVVRTVQGTLLPIRAETICIHGDGAHAVAFARTVRERLAQAGVQLCAVAAM